MNKWAIPLVLIIILVFGVLLFLNQGKAANVPQLPADANTFQPITPATNSQQGGQVQGAQANSQQAQQAAAQQQAAQQQAAEQQAALQATLTPAPQMKASYSAVISTTEGDITVTLRGDAAPRTVQNFINKANSGFYKNLTFHRVEDWVIQGGDPNGDGSGGGNMQTEINQLPFTAGSLGVARKNDIRVSNDSQFFITKTDASWLNEQYTNFGNVTDGMDVVQKMKIGDKILSITVEQ